MKNFGQHKLSIEVAGEIIDLIRQKFGKKYIDSPYDMETWAEDYLTNHSNLFETGRFKEND